MRNNMFLSFQMLKLTKKKTKYTILLIPNFFSSSDNIIIVVIKQQYDRTNIKRHNKHTGSGLLCKIHSLPDHVCLRKKMNIKISQNVIIISKHL